MRARIPYSTAVIHGSLVAILVVLGAFVAAGCADNGAPNPQPSTSVSSAAPASAEITAAVWELINPKLQSGELAPIETVTVDRVTRDAEGRWVASVYLTPPATASYWPSRIVVVRKATGWHVVSLAVDKTFGGTKTGT